MAHLFDSRSKVNNKNQHNPVLEVSSSFAMDHQQYQQSYDNAPTMAATSVSSGNHYHQKNKSSVDEAKDPNVYYMVKGCTVHWASSPRQFAPRCSHHHHQQQQSSRHHHSMF